MKKSRSEKILQYTAVFEPAEEGGYVVSVPALPGCVTQGETLEEAQVMVKDAIELYLSFLKDEGMEIPRENDKVMITKVSVENPANVHGNL